MTDQLTTALHCSACGAIAQPGARFCSGCGAPAPTAASVPTSGEEYAPQATAEPSASVDNSRAWLLALAPVLTLAIDLALLSSGLDATSFSLIAAAAVSIAVLVWDSRYLRNHGHDVGIGAGIILYPIYLFRRAKALRQAQTLTVVWMAAFLASIGGGAALANHYVTLDMDYVESSIADWVDSQAATSAFVTCPDRSTYPVGGSFVCTAGDFSGSISLRVTVENSDGDITWQALG